jgi:sulfur transfer protein SufE/stress-induced morphogen
MKDDDNESDDRDEIILSSLTPELRKLTLAFRAVQNDQLRYKQLLYMANQLPEFPSSLRVESNRVRGCLSTVYVQGSITSTSIDNNIDRIVEPPRIVFQGDSDGLLTKGLVSLLVRGLSNCTLSEIEQVNPSFIEVAGIATSLTPGRNNGFLNMLSQMKDQARAAVLRYQQQQQHQTTMIPQSSSTSSRSSSSSNSNEENVIVATNNHADVEPDVSVASPLSNGSKDHHHHRSSSPIHDTIMSLLSQDFDPIDIQLVNISPGKNDKSNDDENSSSNGNVVELETHFQLSIVSDAFMGMNMIKRQKSIYAALATIMPQIHTLQIVRALTPIEVEKIKN